MAMQQKMDDPTYVRDSPGPYKWSDDPSAGVQRCMKDAQAELPDVEVVWRNPGADVGSWMWAKERKKSSDDFRVCTRTPDTWRWDNGSSFFLHRQRVFHFHVGELECKAPNKKTRSFVIRIHSFGEPGVH